MFSNKDQPTVHLHFAIRERVRESGNYMQLENSGLKKKNSSKANQLQRLETPKFFRIGKWLYELFLHYFHTQIIVSYR